MSSNPSTLVTRLKIQPGTENAFASLQGKWHQWISNTHGFSSLEFIAPTLASEDQWVIIQQFNDPESLQKWKNSGEYTSLINELKTLLSPNTCIDEKVTNESLSSGVIEVFVTKIKPKLSQEYRDWIAKIHLAESKFPGFQKVFVQAPKDEAAGSWITILQFDTKQNLDRWMQSPEREEIMIEGQKMIASLESHRVLSSFAGWFPETEFKGKTPPKWKQSMIILLVLFPIVMLELQYLSPITKPLNLSLGTFIGNALSVSLLAWPFVPIAIYLLKWWLVPQNKQPWITHIFGTFLITAIYLLEIIFFWK